MPVPPLEFSKPLGFHFDRIVAGAAMPRLMPEEYLERAQEAERSADQSQSEIAKHSWRAIASEFRALAAARLKQMQERGDEDK